MALARPIVKAVKSLAGKSTKSESDLAVWMDAHPEVDEGSRKGFADIRAGRYRKINAGTRA